MSAGTRAVQLLNEIKAFHFSREFPESRSSWRPVVAESLEPELNVVRRRSITCQASRAFYFSVSATNSEDYVPNPQDGLGVCLSRSSHLGWKTARLRKKPLDGSEETHIVLIDFTS